VHQGRKKEGGDASESNELWRSNKEELIGKKGE
jgi:hypothetical protein